MKGLVASGHASVTEAAAAMLEAGGNAFDAAVAAGFAAAVAEPALTSLGGGGFLLARTADGSERLFDFFVDTPGRGLGSGSLEPHFLPVTVDFPEATQVFHVGLGSVAVPGCLRGFLHVHERLGRLPLAEVLAPAVRLARAGVPLGPFQASLKAMLRPILVLTPGARALFQPGGRDLEEGHLYRNSDLAAFLEVLPSEGHRALYDGEAARGIDRDMRAGEGLVTLEDLAAYRVIERRPLVLSYRGRRFATNPPPSFGGGLIALSLRLLEEVDLGTDFGSPRHLGALVAVMDEVNRLRGAGVLTPEALAAAGPDLAASAVRMRTATRGTTHVSVADGRGNVAAMTTSNGEGSGYVVPGTGIMLNNMMGEDDLHPDGFHSSPPGRRVASMMAPSLLLEGGQPRLALGSGGSKRIRSAILQVLVNAIDFGLPLAEAVAAPRLHLEDRLELEPGFEAEALAVLARRWPFHGWSQRHMFFGGVHAVALPDQAVGDARRGGAARVLE